jgi:hypothetical protein
LGIRPRGERGKRIKRLRDLGINDKKMDQFSLNSYKGQVEADPPPPIECILG